MRSAPTWDDRDRSTIGATLARFRVVRSGSALATNSHDKTLVAVCRIHLYPSFKDVRTPLPTNLTLCREISRGNAVGVQGCVVVAIATPAGVGVHDGMLHVEFSDSHRRCGAWGPASPLSTFTHDGGQPPPTRFVPRGARSDTRRRAARACGS